MYKACLAALSAVVAVAFAAQSEKPTVEADESFPMIDTADLPKDYKDPHVFLAKRVYSSVPLESEIATSIADELDKNFGGLFSCFLLDTLYLICP